MGWNISINLFNLNFRANFSHPLLMIKFRISLYAPVNNFCITVRYLFSLPLVLHNITQQLPVQIKI